MDIKQLKINGIAFYPKVPVEAIINVDPITGEETTTPAIDTTVKPNSDNLVTSGAVYNAMQSSTITVDDALNANSTNPVQNKVLNGTIGSLQQSISGVSSQLNNKLSSGDLKTVNGQSLVGSGDITITPGSDITVDNQLSNTSTNPVQNKVIAGEISSLSGTCTDLTMNKQAKLVSGTNIKTINGQSLLGSGNITISGGEAVATEVKSLRFDDNATLALEGTDEVYVQGLDGITTGKSNDTTITIRLAEQVATDISNAVSTAAEAISAVGDLEDSIPVNLADLEDVVTTGLAAGKVLKYNGSKWEPADDNAGGGSSITIDSALDTRSTNPVENKAVAGEIANVQYQINEINSDLSNFYYTQSQTNDLLGAKQNTLVSGTNIKTINNQSILGDGNITISGGGSTTLAGLTDVSVAGASNGSVLKYDGSNWYAGTDNTSEGASGVNSFVLNSGTMTASSQTIQLKGAVPYQGTQYVKTSAPSGNVIEIDLTDEAKAMFVNTSKPTVKTFDINTSSLASYTVSGETKFKYFCLKFPITESGSSYLFDCKHPVKVDVQYFDTNYDRTDTAFASFVLNADFVSTSSAHYGWKNVYNVYNDGAKYISAGANIAGNSTIVKQINPAPDVYEWIISRDSSNVPCVLFPIGINKSFSNTTVQLKVTVSGLPSDGQGDVTVYYGGPGSNDDMSVSLASVNNEIQ